MRGQHHGKRLTEQGSDLLCALGVHALDLLHLRAILVNDDGGGLGDAEVCLGLVVLVDVDLVGVGGGGVLVRGTASNSSQPIEPFQ